MLTIAVFDMSNIAIIIIITKEQKEMIKTV